MILRWGYTEILQQNQFKHKDASSAAFGRLPVEAFQSQWILLYVIVRLIEDDLLFGGKNPMF